MVKKQYQNILDPLIVSWGYDGTEPSTATFQQFHQFNGTRDFSAYLLVPAAIRFMQQNKWNELSGLLPKTSFIQCARILQSIKVNAHLSNIG